MKSALKFVWSNLAVLVSVFVFLVLGVAAYGITGKVMPERTYTAWQAFSALCFYVALWDLGRAVGRKAK